MRSRYGMFRDRNVSDRVGSEEVHALSRAGWSNLVEDKGNAIASPVFLVGSVRSGTTLLRLMLDHHPELAFFHEFSYAVEKMPESGWPDLAAYYEYLKSDRIFQSSNFAIDKSLDYPQLINSFLRQKRDRDQKKLVGATVHVHFDHLLRIWPEARFIHVIRDGRDVARSRIELGWSGNMYTGVQSWIDAERLWEKVREQIPTSRRMDLKYEDLIMNPVGELTRACNFLDLPYDPAMLRYDENSTYSTPDPRLIGQWRSKVSRQAVRLAEARIGDMLVERGYELSGQDRLEISPLQERLLLLDDRKNRLAARRRFYGTSLFAAELVARSLGPVHEALTNFRSKVRHQMNEVELSALK